MRWGLCSSGGTIHVPSMSCRGPSDWVDWFEIGSWVRSIPGGDTTGSWCRRSGGDVTEAAEARGKSEQVREHVQALLASLDPHQKLPTERQLADELGVSRLTVRSAIGALEREGRVYRIQGSGTFVAAPLIAKALELTGFSEDMRSRNKVPGSLRVSVDRVPAGAVVSAKLTISPSSQVVHIQRVRTADGIPMAWENVWLPASLIPEDFALGEGRSLYDLLESSGARRPHHADQTVTATVVDEQVAELLQVGPYSPALSVERVVRAASGEAIEYGISIYRGDRYSYDLTIYR